MNATACERVAQFALNYTPEISKTINRMEKIKL